MSCPVILLETDDELRLFGPDDIYRFDVDNRPLRMFLVNDQRLRDCIGLLWTEISDARGGYQTLDARLDAMDALIATQNNVYLNSTAGILTRGAYLRQMTWSGYLPDADVLTYNSFPNAITYESADTILVPRQTLIVDGFVVTVQDDVFVSPNAIGSPPSPAAGFSRIQFGPGPDGGSMDGRIDLLFLEVWIVRVDRGTPVFQINGSMHQGTTSDPFDYRVRDTIDALPDGDFMQVQYRWRIHEDLVYAKVPGVITPGSKWGLNHGYRRDPLESPAIKVQGPNGSLTALGTGGRMTTSVRSPYVQENVDNVYSDESMGSNYTGALYTLPFGIFSRRNDVVWDIENQNGNLVSTGGGQSDRPDGLYFDQLSKKETEDCRFYLTLTDWSYTSLISRCLHELVSGVLDTRFRELKYDSDHDYNFSEETEVFGNIVMACDMIVPPGGGGDSGNTNPLRDWNLSSVVTAGSPPARNLLTAPLAGPDAVRLNWGGAVKTQNTFFQFVEDNDASENPSVFVTWDPTGGSGNGVLTLDTTPLSGAPTFEGSDPVMFWEDGDTPVLALAWTVGATSASCQLEVADRAAHSGQAVYGTVGIDYDAGSGLRHPLLPRRTQESYLPVLGQEINVPSSWNYRYGVTGATPSPAPSTTASGPMFWGYPYIYTPVANGDPGDLGTAYGPQAIGWNSASGKVYVADGNRVARINASTLAKEGQFGLGNTAGSTNALLSSPRGVCSDATNLVFVGDTGNHRVVKVTDDADPMTYTVQFGTTGVSGSDTASLTYPCGVATDGSNYVAVADYGNNRVMLLNMSLTYVARFGTGAAGTVSSSDKLNKPLDLAFSPGGEYLYVTDSGSKRIVALDVAAIVANGAGADDGVDGYITKYGTGTLAVDWETLTTMVDFPTSITVDEDGFIIYVEGGGSRIVKLWPVEASFAGTPKIIWVSKIGSQGSGYREDAGDVGSPYVQVSPGQVTLNANPNHSSNIPLRYGIQALSNYRIFMAKVTCMQRFHQEMAYVDTVERKLEILKAMAESPGGDTDNSHYLRVWYHTPVYQGALFSWKNVLLYRPDGIWFTTGGSGARAQNPKTATVTDYAHDHPGLCYRPVLDYLPVYSAMMRFTIAEADLDYFSRSGDGDGKTIISRMDRIWRYTDDESLDTPVPISVSTVVGDASPYHRPFRGPGSSLWILAAAGGALNAGEKAVDGEGRGVSLSGADMRLTWRAQNGPATDRMGINVALVFGDIFEGPSGTETYTPVPDIRLAVFTTYHDAASNYKVEAGGTQGFYQREAADSFVLPGRPLPPKHSFA